MPARGEPPLEPRRTKIAPADLKVSDPPSASLKQPVDKQQHDRPQRTVSPAFCLLLAVFLESGD